MLGGIAIGYMAEFIYESTDLVTTAIIGRFYRAIQGGVTP